MTITRYSPKNITTPVLTRSLSDFMDEIFQDAFNRVPMSDTFVPTVDVIEHDTNYELRVNLPGMHKKDVKIEIEDNRLVISGERTFEREEKSKASESPKYHRIESGYGAFKRSFSLSNDIKRDNIKATFDNGVLTITLEKTESGISKMIQIT